MFELFLFERFRSSERPFSRLLDLSGTWNICRVRTGTHFKMPESRRNEMAKLGELPFRGLRVLYDARTARAIVWVESAKGMNSDSSWIAKDNVSKLMKNAFRILTKVIGSNQDPQWIFSLSDRKELLNGIIFYIKDNSRSLHELLLFLFISLLKHIQKSATHTCSFSSS